MRQVRIRIIRVRRLLRGDLKEGLFKEVEQQRLLCFKFTEPYRFEMVYIIAARQRYKAFLFMLQRFTHECSSRLVPTSDILLMWLTHQSYPTVSTEDLKALAIDTYLQRVATLSKTMMEKEFKKPM
ncbi:hypothetical protein RJT34_12990 [Clitoria ternatea]|uniref:Uncharacterized protein n=1 Tax=Clitoria ternatea TaxID=43366 RepID=A0AAN9JMT9_CLITE